MLSSLFVFLSYVSKLTKSQGVFIFIIYFGRQLNDQKGILQFGKVGCILGMIKRMITRFIIKRCKVIRQKLFS